MFLLPASHLETRRTGTMGRGVFARRTLESGRIVGDYLGWIREPPRRGEPQSHADRPYAMFRNAREIIDPDPHTPGVHHVNHGCEPNVGIALWKGHVLYVTTRRVFAGEQLLVDYWLPAPSGTSPWHRCRCGAPHCRGVVELTTRALDASDRYWWRVSGAAMQKRSAAYDQPMPPLASYPARMNDVREHPIWGSLARPPLACDDPTVPPLGVLRARLRESGRRLRFVRLGVRIDGLMDRGEIVAHLSHGRAATARSVLASRVDASVGATRVSTAARKAVRK